MTISSLPGHRDIARALSATLATHRGQQDEVLAVMAAEATGEEAEAFIRALLIVTATILERKVDDVENYLLAWVALELELADAAEAPDDEG